MKVFVTGGTGAIGVHAVPALVRAGHQVTALARTQQKAAALAEQGAAPASVSLFDRVRLADALAGQDAVINLASALPSMTKFLSSKAWRENNHVRVDGSAAIVDAALEAHVPRMVQESVSMIDADHGARWIDENAPVDWYPAARANIAAESNARRFGEAGGSATVLRFGWFYGPGAAHSEQMLAAARRHIVMVLGPPDSYVSSIHVADAAAAVAAVLHAQPGTFNVVDDEPLSKQEYARALAGAAGASPWLRGPGRAGLLFGDRLTSLTRSVRVSNARFRAATDWAPQYPSARDGWRATAAARLGGRAGR